MRFPDGPGAPMSREQQAAVGLTLQQPLNRAPDGRRVAFGISRGADLFPEERIARKYAMRSDP